MNLYVSSLNSGAVQAFRMRKGASYTDAQIDMIELETRKIHVFERIEEGEEWWLMLLPKPHTDGDLKFISWVTEKDLPEEELAVIQAEEERQAAELEAKRKAAEEAAQKLAEAEAAKIAAEKARIAAEEAAKKAAEEAEALEAAQ